MVATVRHSASGASMEFSVTYEHLSGGITVVQVVGEVDVRRAPRLREVLVALVERRRVLLAVDLGRTVSVDSTGLGVLVGSLKRVRAQRGGLVVVTRQDRVLGQFRASGLSRVFLIRPSVAQAVEVLAGIGPGRGERPRGPDGRPVGTG